MIVKCPFCGYEGEFKEIKAWKFLFYNVKMLECPRCEGRFNHYLGMSPKGKRSEFVIRIGCSKRGSRVVKPKC